jgi:ribose transport system permease protein
MTTTTTPPTEAGRAPIDATPKRTPVSVGFTVQRFALLAAWVLIVIIFSVLRPDTYFSAGNFQSIFGSQAVLLVLALGLLLALITGSFDLSIAANLTFSSMLLAILQTQANWPLLPAILATLVAGALIGTLNGYLVVALEIDSFIVTLGTGTVLQGVVLWISGSQTISGIDNTLINLTANYRFLGISLGFWYGTALMLVLAYVLTFTAVGRRMLFVGKSRNVARLSGVNVNRVQWGSLIAAGTIAAFAGVLYTGSQGAADPTSGLGFMLPAFAACYLGATALQPGRFNPIGTFIAVFFLVSGITGLQILGVNSYVQQLFYGTALVLAVALSQIPQRRLRKKGTR